MEASEPAVRGFCNLSFNLKKPEEAGAKYIGCYCRQHNPSAGDGTDLFIALVRGFVKAFPSSQFNLKRIVAEGRLVVGVDVADGHQFASGSARRLTRYSSRLQY